MLIIAQSYALHCPFSLTLKVNMEQWLLLNRGSNNIKAGQAGKGGGGRKGAGRNWVTCQLCWQQRSARKLWPIFQSKHDSLNRDAPEINSFPVLRPAEAGTTPSCGFVSGYCGYRSELLGGVAWIKMAILKELVSLGFCLLLGKLKIISDWKPFLFPLFFFFSPQLQATNLLFLLTVSSIANGKPDTATRGQQEEQRSGRQGEGQAGGCSSERYPAAGCKVTALLEKGEST